MEGGERKARVTEEVVSDRRPSTSYWQRKVEEYFRPEFVNRIDQIVVFDALGAETVRQFATFTSWAK